MKQNLGADSKILEKAYKYCYYLSPRMSEMVLNERVNGEQVIDAAFFNSKSRLNIWDYIIFFSQFRHTLIYNRCRQFKRKKEMKERLIKELIKDIPQ